MKNKVRQNPIRRILSARSGSVTLRMAPMIDMIFLLLIFFLVTAQWRPEEDFLPLKLPSAYAQSYEPGKPEPLVINIRASQAGCRVRLAGIETIDIAELTIEQDLAELLQKLTGLLKSQKRYASDPVEIAPEPNVKWEYLAKIYNLLYGAGMTDITFLMTE